MGLLNFPALEREVMVYNTILRSKGQRDLVFILLKLLGLGFCWAIPSILASGYCLICGNSVSWVLILHLLWWSWPWFYFKLGGLFIQFLLLVSFGLTGLCCISACGVSEGSIFPSGRGFWLGFGFYLCICLCKVLIFLVIG